MVAQPRARPVLAPRIALPIIAVLAYAAFLTTGFGTFLDDLGKSAGYDLRPLPLYAFFGILLLALQAAISDVRSIPRIIYIFLTSGFAIVYAADVVFFRGNLLFVHDPLTYLVLNVLAIGIFVYDTVDRRRARPSGLEARGRSDPPGTPGRDMTYGAFAADFAGLAILGYITWGVLLVVASGVIPGLQVVVDLNKYGVFIPGGRYLPNLDLILALAATTVSLALMVITGWLLVGTDPTALSAGKFWQTVGTIVGDAMDGGLLSLRLVLNPFVWLIPAFSIAVFSQQFAQYLAHPPITKDGTIWDLFNPLTLSPLQAGAGLLELVLAALAIVAVLVAVAVVEHEIGVIGRTLQIIGAAGRGVALTSGLFLVSLATFNAVANLTMITDLRPFQLGFSMVVALVAVGGLTVYSVVRQRTQKKE